MSGVLITGLRVRFEGGNAVEIDADQGAETLRALSQRDPGAARLGEVALVDRESRIGSLDTVFFDTLLDENAASHIALGEGLDFTVLDPADQQRINRSELHIDFMIGSNEVAVTGIEPGGPRSRCSGTASGSSEARTARATLGRPQRRGAGAVERARLEIA